MTVDIKHLGHSAFLITSNKKSILIDPFISGNPKSENINFDDYHITDIFVTHAHSDHIGDTIDLAKQTGAKVNAVFEVANYCAQKGVKTQGLNIGGKVNFPIGTCKFYQAAHSSSLPDGSYGGIAASLIFEISGKTIYHAGDTGLFSDLKMIGELHSIDLALLPVGGTFTMDVADARIAKLWLRAKKVFPMHYNTFDVINVNKEKLKDL